MAGTTVGERTARDAGRWKGVWPWLLGLALLGCDPQSCNGTQQQLMLSSQCPSTAQQACAAGQQFACSRRVCVNTVHEGAACALDPCVALAEPGDLDTGFRDTCDVGLACVPDASPADGGRPTRGTCAPVAPPAMNGGFDCRGWNDVTSCGQWQFCKAYSSDREAQAKYACALDANATTVLRADGSAPRSFAVCVLPAPEGSACDSNWSDTAAAGAQVPEHPFCSPCAPGLLCLGSICRRPCANANTDCPCTADEGRWTCKAWDGTNGQKVCGPGQGLGGRCGTVADGGAVVPNGAICTDPTVNHCAANGICGYEDGHACETPAACAGGACLGGECGTCIANAADAVSRAAVPTCHSSEQCCATHVTPDGGPSLTLTNDCVPVTGTTISICCPHGWSNCGQTDDRAALCVDTQHDRQNCGGCGVQCNSPDGCINGQCACGGPVLDGGRRRDEYCPTPTGGACLDTQDDPANCGSCGHHCGPDAACEGGVCRCGIPTGRDGGLVRLPDGGIEINEQFTDCNGTCANLAFDSMHCGACSTQCPAGQGCSASVCRPLCTPGHYECDGACVSNSNENCGECHRTCPGGMACILATGSCPGQCAPGLAGCGSACVNHDTDSANCGSCGHACGAGQMCTGGHCAAATCARDNENCYPNDPGRAQCCPNMNLSCVALPITLPSGTSEGFSCQANVGIGDAGAPTYKNHCETCTPLDTCTRVDGQTHYSCTSGTCDIEGTCSMDGGTSTSCPSGETHCITGCVNLATNHENCTSCGRACGASQACNRGCVDPASLCDGGDCSCVGVGNRCGGDGGLECCSDSHCVGNTCVAN